jgi:hypothetical protein
MTRFPKFLLAALLLALAVPSALPAATEPESPSAQSLLFDANYLLPLAAPSRIVYSFSHKTADPERFGQGFEDEVALKLSPSEGGDGAKDVTVDMFTLDRHRERVIGPLTRVSGNPIIMMFLERDVTQMNRHIGGQPVYFRNVIRMAFRDKARLEPASFSWEGRQVNGTRIVIQPFMGDPNGERMALFRSKTYEFIVSDAVPGGIYQMHSTVADGQTDEKTLALDTRMTLKEIAYDQPKN